jgi:hypothetical protein
VTYLMLFVGYDEKGCSKSGQVTTRRGICLLLNLSARPSSVAKMRNGAEIRIKDLDS